MEQARITVAMTGASGAAYGLRLLEQLLRANCHVHLVLSAPAQIVIKMETDLSLPARAADIQTLLSERYHAEEGQLEVFGREQWTAPIASGSAAPQAMVICPCTVGTLSAVACGSSRNLIERAADVMLKEQRKLVLVVRETPFSVIHLENMLRLAKMGAVIMPANPAFYQHPKKIEDLVDFMVARILDHLNITHELQTRWGLESE